MFYIYFLDLLYAIKHTLLLSNYRVCTANSRGVVVDAASSVVAIQRVDLMCPMPDCASVPLSTSLSLPFSLSLSVCVFGAQSAFLISRPDAYQTLNFSDNGFRFLFLLQFRFRFEFRFWALVSACCSSSSCSLGYA